MTQGGICAESAAGNERGRGAKMGRVPAFCCAKNKEKTDGDGEKRYYYGENIQISHKSDKEYAIVFIDKAQELIETNA